MSELIEYRLTFGSQYSYQVHPGYRAAHPDGWLAVLAPDERAARLGVIGAITNAWSCIYAPGDEGYPREGDGLYPRGEVGRLRVLDATGEHWQWLRRTETGEWVERPIVWAFCNGEMFGDQEWIAVADDGRVITAHVSSNESWGRHDVSPEGFHRGRYVEILGTDQVDYRVLPLGASPPDHVRERHDALIAEQDRADEESRDA